MDALHVVQVQQTHLRILRQRLQLQVGVQLVAHVDITTESFHHTELGVEVIQAIHNGDVRKVQVHRLLPIYKYIFGAHHIDMLDVCGWTKYAKSLVYIVVRLRKYFKLISVCNIPYKFLTHRKRASWKMENYRFFGPIFSNIKLKIPNTIIQVRFYGLMKLQEK